MPWLEGSDSLPILLEAVTKVSRTWPGFLDEKNHGDATVEMRALMLSTGRMGSLAQSVDRMQQAARAVQPIELFYAAMRDYNIERLRRLSVDASGTLQEEQDAVYAQRIRGAVEELRQGQRQQAASWMGWLLTDPDNPAVLAGFVIRVLTPEELILLQQFLYFSTFFLD